jgi:hypothetical protein
MSSDQQNSTEVYATRLGLDMDLARQLAQHVAAYLDLSFGCKVGITEGRVTDTALRSQEIIVVVYEEHLSETRLAQIKSAARQYAMGFREGWSAGHRR